MNPDQAQPDLVPFRVAFLTGQSQPGCWHLEEEQRAFLRALVIPEAWKVYWNFPWEGCSEAPRPISLGRASVANTMQFLRAGERKRRAEAARSLERFGAGAERTVFLAGSCGLEILRQAARGSGLEQIAHVFALGPVAWKRPGFPVTLIQGSRDPYSGAFFRRIDVRVPGVGHMGYLTNPLVIEVVNDALRGLTRAGQALTAKL